MKISFHVDEKKAGNRCVFKVLVWCHDNFRLNSKLRDFVMKPSLLVLNRFFSVLVSFCLTPKFLIFTLYLKYSGKYDSVWTRSWPSLVTKQQRRSKLWAPLGRTLGSCTWLTEPGSAFPAGFNLFVFR